MSDLTADEQRNVRAALRFLRTSTGGIAALAKGLRADPAYLRRVIAGNDPVGASVAVRVAGAGVADVLDGKYPPAGACPHCGHGPQRTRPTLRRSGTALEARYGARRRRRSCWRPTACP